MRHQKFATSLLMFVSAVLLSACTGTRPVHLGSENSSLPPCPDSPNCVSSQADKNDAEHFIEAIAPLSASNNDPINALATIIKHDPAAELIVEGDQYLYAEYTSSIMRFVDDVEFLYFPEQNLIHVRSASRIGRSDFGVNRERIEAIRTVFKK